VSAIVCHLISVNVSVAKYAKKIGFEVKERLASPSRDRVAGHDGTKEVVKGCGDGKNTGSDLKS
jgi:hypothetical protein